MSIKQTCCFSKTIQFDNHLDKWILQCFVNRLLYSASVLSVVNINAAEFYSN